MDRNDVSWHGYWPACPTPFHADGASTSTRSAPCSSGTSARACTACSSTARPASGSRRRRRSGGSSPRPRSTRSRAASRSSIGCTSLHRARGDRARAVTRSRPAPSGIGSTPPPYSKTFPDETVAYFSDISDGDRRADHGLQLAARHSVDIDPALAEPDRRHRERRRDQGQHAERAAVLRDGADRRRPDARLRPVHVERRASSSCSPHGGDGFIGGGSLFGAPDAEFWEALLARRPRVLPRARGAHRRLFPKLWLPGGWGGQYGAYQSQLKAIMKMLGQPGGEVRRPRLPVTDPASLRAMQRRS